MLPFIVGTILGAIYFGGLYFTTQKIGEVEKPTLLIVLSFILRMGLLILTFFYLSKGGYKDMLIALVALIIVRFIMTHSINKNEPESAKRGD